MHRIVGPSLELEKLGQVGPMRVGRFRLRRPRFAIATRAFTGTVREIDGFVVRIEGIHRDNQRCTRQVVVDAESVETRMKSEAVRQLAAVLVAAVDEIQARR